MEDYELDEIEQEPIEGYCMRCRESIEMETPIPVWTRRGMPATRGECPTCGGLVFRMGKTDAHRESERPEAITVGSTKRNQPKLAPNTVYVNFADDDQEIAEQLASDLEKIGVAVWRHGDSNDNSNWAGGVHPALNECSQMVYLLSESSLTEESIEQAWKFFREKRKPIIIAQIQDQLEPPDAIRRSARFNFITDYKSAFRQMIQSLNQ